MSLFKSISEKSVELAKISVDSITESTQKTFSSILQNMFSKQENITDVKTNTTEEILSVKDEEKSLGMLKILDAAYKISNSDVLGLGTCKEMAEKYLKENNGDKNAAINSVIHWCITYSATAGFVTSLGGLLSMLVTLPLNIAGIMVIQLRMIGVIAHLSGSSKEEESHKTGVYLCLLGAEVGDFSSKIASQFLSETTSQFTIKITTAALKKLPGEVLIKINQAVGFRLVTKFGTKGLINLHKAIPILGGIVGSSVDSISTYLIAKAAKKMFCSEELNFYEEENLELNRMRILINMALVDGVYGEEEKKVLLLLASSLSVSEKVRVQLFNEIENPKYRDIDYELFKKDPMISECLLRTLNNMILADEQIHPKEENYLNEIAEKLGYDATKLDQILKK